MEGATEVNTEHGFKAKDKKAGMTLEELDVAVAAVKLMSPGKKFRLKATAGFGGQLQVLTFVEVEDVVPPAA